MNVANILSICGGVSIIGGAAMYIYKLVVAIGRPAKEINEKIDNLGAEVEALKNEVDKYKNRLGKNDETTTIILQALLCLLEHGIDGNNISKMEKAKDTLEKWLTKSHAE